MMRTTRYLVESRGTGVRLDDNLRLNVLLATSSCVGEVFLVPRFHTYAGALGHFQSGAVSWWSYGPKAPAEEQHRDSDAHTDPDPGRLPF